MSEPLSVGDMAPDFSLPASDKSDVSISALKGRFIVLYFYPRDDTAGCTSQAKAFSALKDEFEAAGATIIGVSADSLESHEKFIAKHNLRITLASDETTMTLDKYGVWVDKKMYGRVYKGIDRTTYLIDKSGLIRHIWRKIRVSGHVEAVLEKLHSLN